MTREEHWKIVDAVIDAHKDNEMGGKYAKAFNHGVQSAFNRVCKALKDIEQQQQPNRCDSCTHSEEQDGSNCYECVKGIADNFEAQPTNMRDATEEERKSVKDYIESISKPTGVQLEAQPCEDCISREAVIKNIKWWFDKIELNPDILIDSMITLPSVTPERPKGKWIEDTQTGFKIRCSECGARNFGADRAYCPRCGRQMKEDNDD